MFTLTLQPSGLHYSGEEDLEFLWKMSKLMDKAFENSLKNPLEWLKKDKEDVARLLGHETAAMVDFEQRNPHHCYTLFEHAIRTVEGLPKDCSDLLNLDSRDTALGYHYGKCREAA